MGDSSSQSFVSRHWEGLKEFWSERFSFIDDYSPFVKRDKPLPFWSSSDVEEFIASDPVHGPNLKATRKAANVAFTGALLGAASTAVSTWKYSKSPHGAGLSFLAGGAFGYTLGHEAAQHLFQLYKLDTNSAQVKFLQWWQDKTEGGY